MRDLVSDGSNVKSKGCRKHSKPYTHFCKTCEIQVCTDCCSSDHRESSGHVTQDLTHARQEQRHLLEVEVAEAQETILAAQPKIKSLEAEKGCLFAASHKSEADIETTFQQYFEVLKARKEALIEESKRLYKFKRKEIVDQIALYSKQIVSLEGLLEHCEEAVSGANISDLMAYRSKLTSKNQEFRSTRPTGHSSDNFLKFDPEDTGNQVLDLIQDMGCITLNSSLPAAVKAFEQPVISGLYSNMSFEIKNAAGEPLANYPITVQILDTYDDEVPCMTKVRNGGRYEVTFKPKISGLHRVKVQFLDHAIIGGDFNLNVLSNNPVATIGSKGSLDGELEYPRALATTSDGKIYVMDTGNNRIVSYSKTGTFLFTFPISHESQCFSSCGIAINKEQGTIVCPEVQMDDADMVQSNTVLVYSLEGRLLHRLKFEDTLCKALSIAVNSMGHMIIADFELHSVFIFDKQGRRLLKKFGEQGSSAGQLDRPTFVCVGEDDSIIVSDGDNHRIQVFDKMGKFLYQFGSKGNGKGEFNMPFGVAADLHGNILVVDGGNKRIQIFKTGGEFVCCIESLVDKMNAPRGIAVTSDGYVLVADRDNHCVKKFKYLHSTLL